jgi:hypothetical protein
VFGPAVSIAALGLKVLLLNFANHVVDGSHDLGIGEIDTATLRWHVARRTCVTLQCVLFQGVSTLGDTLCPLTCITEYRRATNAGTMTRQTGCVVDLWPRHSGCDRLRFGWSLNSRGTGLMFLPGPVNLPDRTNTLSDSFLVLGGVARVNALCEIGHLHCQHENRQGDRGKNADYEGIHIKKLLVPTQLTAPEGMKKVSPGAAPDGGGRLYNISRRGTAQSKHRLFRSPCLWQSGEGGDSR